MPELSEKLNISQASISRGIRKLSKYGDGGEIKGYDLVYATPDIEDRRRYAVFLTPKGEELRKKIDFGES